MVQNTKRRVNKGLNNSSLTRVYPLFGSLIEKDPSGHSWLPNILSFAQSRAQSELPIPNPIGLLLPEVAAKRKISGNVLKYHGIESISLPSCFEKSVPPSYRFLHWLIKHPEKMTWPNKGKARYSARAQSKREELLGWHGKDKQAAAQREAFAALEQKGAERAHGKWWSFEGTTSADCFLETRNLILLFEGKRTESFSESVHWYPGRNQLVRNLEVAQEIAGKKHFGVLVIAEEDIGPIVQQVVENSLPHFTPGERNALMEHYLGCVTWRQVCDAVGFPFEKLPDTVPDWIASLSL